jgi:hypothetical protein
LKNFHWSPFSKWPPQYCTNDYEVSQTAHWQQV